MTVIWDDLDPLEAAEWCRDERPDWPLDRSLRVWLLFEKDSGDWNPDDPDDLAQYDRLFDAVLTVWREDRLSDAIVERRGNRSPMAP